MIGKGWKLPSGMEEAPPHKLLKHCLHCLYYSMQYSVLELILPVWIIQNFQAPLPKSASSCVWTSCDGCPINPLLMQLRHIFAHLLAGGVLARDFQWTSPNLVVCGRITCLHAQLIPIKHCLLDLDPPKLSQTDNLRANLGNSWQSVLYFCPNIRLPFSNNSGQFLDLCF